MRLSFLTSDFRVGNRHVFTFRRKTAPLTQLSMPEEPAQPAAEVLAEREEAAASAPGTPSERTPEMRVYRTNSRLAGLPDDFATGGGEKQAALIVAYVSPNVDFRAACEAIRQKCGGRPFVATTTSGELCDTGDGGHLYCSADGSWDNIVIQVFDTDLIEQVSIHSVPLANEDIRGGKAFKSQRERIAQITANLNRINLPFALKAENTVAYALVDGLSASENYFMEAVYASRRFPCLFVGGSAGGKLDFKFTGIYDGSRVLQDHALIAFIKLRDDVRFGVLKSQNFQPTGKSVVVIEACPETRQVTAAVDLETLEILPIIDAVARMLGCRR